MPCQEKLTDFRRSALGNLMSPLAADGGEGSHPYGSDAEPGVGLQDGVVLARHIPASWCSRGG